MILLDDDINRRIRFALRDKGYTQKRLADEMNVSVSYLVKKINGTELIDETRFTQLCDVLETDQNWILNGGEYTPPMPEDTFGQRLLKQIYSKWLSKTEFAQYAELDWKLLCIRCGDKHMPSASMIIYLHDILDVSTDYLLLGKDSEKAG